MKKYKNLLLTINILIIVICFFAIQCISNVKTINDKNAMLYETHQKCLNNNDYREQYDYYCNSIGDYVEKTDFLDNYEFILSNGISKIAFIMPMFILATSLYYISKYFKNNIIKNELNRISYKQIIKKLFRKSYFSLIFIVPFILLIIYISIISNGIESSYSVFNADSSIASALWTSFYIDNPLLLVIFHVISLLIHFILYINVGLIVVRKYHNYYIAVLLSYITLIGIEAILEFGLNVIICNMILKNNYGEIFNIFNYVFFDNHVSYLAPFLIPFILMLITFIIIFIIYKEKELLVIDCEKSKGEII